MRPLATVTTTPDERTSSVSMLTVAPLGTLARSLFLSSKDLTRELMPMPMPITPKEKERKRDARRANL